MATFDRLGLLADRYSLFDPSANAPALVKFRSMTRTFRPPPNVVYRNREGYDQESLDRLNRYLGDQQALSGISVKNISGGMH